jgi:hypothetical protein
MKTTLVVILAIIALATITTAAALFLFTQTQPIVPAGVLSPTCAATTSILAVVPVGGNGGFDLFYCNNVPGTPQPAFVTSPNGGSATPTFTLPAPYTNLTLVSSTAGTPCPNAAAHITLTSGTPVVFAASQGYDYCAGFNTVQSTGLPTWQIRWDQ